VPPSFELEEKYAKIKKISKEIIEKHRQNDKLGKMSMRGLNEV
jgi:hypothetical protein